MARRVDAQTVRRADDLAGDGIDVRELLDLVAEHLHAQHRLLVRGVHLERVAADAELASREVDVVALVLEVDEPPDDVVARDLAALVEVEHVLLVHLGRAEPVDRGHRRDDDRVSPREHGGRRGVAQPVDLVVDGRVLLDVGVRRRDVRLGLVVVVVAHEELDRVVREHLAELRGQLRRQGLVGGHDERRTSEALDHRPHRRGLPGAGRAEERGEPVAALERGDDPFDGLRLVAGELEPGTEGEGLAGLELHGSTRLRRVGDTSVSGIVASCREPPAGGR